jgi:ParB family chromosome partitioning protein
MQVVDFEINRVIVADRQRRPVDNLAGLVASIQDVGLLHPIVVGTDGRLKVGYRRLMAFQQMQRATIPAHMTDDLDEVYRALRAERDENIQREPLPPTVLVARAEELEAEERRRAADRMRATQLNGRDSTGEPVFGCGNFPQPNPTIWMPVSAP